MKTYLKWTLPVALLAVLAYLTWGFTSTLSRKQKAAERIQTLPGFTAYGLDSSITNIAAITNRSVVLIYFDPDCEHCQHEADELRKKAALLTQAQVLMLSSAALPVLKTFAQTHRLTKLSNVQVAHIDRKVAYETFNFTSVPNVIIYRADGTLAKRFRGETSVEAIARHLR